MYSHKVDVFLHKYKTKVTQIVGSSMTIDVTISVKCTLITMDTFNDLVYMDCTHSNRILTYDKNIKQTTKRSLRLLFTVVQEEK